MDLNAYQRLAARTSLSDMGGPERRMLISGLGIAGEAGEVADLIKKAIGHGHGLDRVKLAKELGDVLWYVADLATSNGLDLDEIANVNIDKLRKRYPAGFSAEASIARADVPSPFAGCRCGHAWCPACNDPNFKGVGVGS